MDVGTVNGVPLMSDWVSAAPFLLMLLLSIPSLPAEYDISMMSFPRYVGSPLSSIPSFSLHMHFKCASSPSLNPDLVTSDSDLVRLPFEIILSVHRDHDWHLALQAMIWWSRSRVSDARTMQLMT